MDGQNTAPAQIDLTQILFAAQLSQSILPLHLSETLSINLSKVVRYEPVEKLDDKDKPTGEFVPALIFDGGDVCFLEPDQVEIFRPVWDAYSNLANLILSAAASLAPQNEA